MTHQKQNDFAYTESFKNVDKTPVRRRAKIDLNWKFMQEDVSGAEAKRFDDFSW